MTSARLGQQLTLDFSATVTPASESQEPVAPSSLFGRISQPGLSLWSAPGNRPAKSDVAEPLTAESPKPEPAKPEPLPQTRERFAPSHRPLRAVPYPPDKQEKVTQTVLEQTKLLGGDWAE